ncbi:DUF928 domain-containing protein [Pantanalinema rosaneae CENA516]|uniref:DUF928 domain-containing protein n=1 Tax=Pantanalinema rosaneae TaxID=1620701 RepID=UPI003D6E60C0
MTQKQILTKPLMVWSLRLIVGVLGGINLNPAIASFDPPPEQGSPAGTAGGGSRPAQSACFPQTSHLSGLTALSPTAYVGLTTRDRPTVHIYLPATTAQMAELSLFDAQGRGIYQTTVPISSTDTLVRFSFPSTAPILSADQPYYWAVALICNPNQRTDDWIIGGWIRQQTPDPWLQRQLATASGVEQVKLYAEAGFWYDALETLVQLQQAHPQDSALGSVWARLLQSIGLPQLTRMPSSAFTDQ